MKLVELSRGHVRVRDGARSVTIFGEALLRGYGSSDFVLYQNSIGRWDTPMNHDDVTPAEKEKLIQFVKEEFVRRKMQLEIELGMFLSRARQ